MSPTEDTCQMENNPSIPILGCRWGLGEGVSLEVFKPIPIPPHLLRQKGRRWPDSSRRLQGRGRASVLGPHEDLLQTPGEFPITGVTGLSISEQISRVDLPIDTEPCDYKQHILPRLSDEDSPPSPPAPAQPERIGRSAEPDWRRQNDWAGVLEPWGDVAAVESAQLTSSMRTAADTGAGDAGLKALQRLNAVSDSDPDVLEECTNSSDSSYEWRPRRRWRPRPPPLGEDSFPPLPGAAAAPSSCSGAQAAAGGSQPAPAGTRTAPAQPSAVPPPAEAGAAPAAAEPAATGAAGKEVRVSGVTDENWEQVRQFAEQYGTVVGHRRGCDGDSSVGWVTLSPPDTADWLLSLQEHTPCDISGVVFSLPNGDGADL